MSDEQVVDEVETVAEVAEVATPAAVEAPAADFVPRVRLNEEIAKRKELAALVKKLEGDTAVLSERAGVADRLAAELAWARLEATKYRVAYELGLPAEIVPRVVGKDEESLRADGESLRAVLRQAGPVGVPAPPERRPAERVDLGQMTPAQIREMWPMGR